MNIHLPAILGFTRYQGFDPSPYQEEQDIDFADFATWDSTTSDVTNAQFFFFPHGDCRL